uniref:SFRICE_038214 n=1 Tax=Spodoptera frugiperda TaxID=7108 RepID=A0A2H1X0I4_SPOFR
MFEAGCSSLGQFDIDETFALRVISSIYKYVEYHRITSPALGEGEVLDSLTLPLATPHGVVFSQHLYSMIKISAACDDIVTINTRHD